MNSYTITSEQIEAAKCIFRDSSNEKLIAISTKINREQPNFTGVVLALEMHGLDRMIVEDLLESIFIIYYAQTQLNHRTIPTISIEEVVENVHWFGQFIDYFNHEKKNTTSDLAQFKFLRDEIVLSYAVDTLNTLFGGLKNIPKEVTFGYFSLLKGIEIGAEQPR